MKPKGYTLIEVLAVILMIGIIGSSIQVGSAYVQRVAFETLVKEVEKGIINAQQRAVATGRQYNVYCTEKKVYIRQGVNPPIYLFQMGEEVTIPIHITGKHIKFNGTMAPSKAGTIEFLHRSLGKKARITIRVATGKTTVYFEALK